MTVVKAMRKVYEARLSSGRPPSGRDLLFFATQARVEFHRGQSSGD